MAKDHTVKDMQDRRKRGSSQLKEQEERLIIELPPRTDRGEEERGVELKSRTPIHAQCLSPSPPATRFARRGNHCRSPAFKDIHPQIPYYTKYPSQASSRRTNITTSTTSHTTTKEHPTRLRMAWPFSTSSSSSRHGHASSSRPGYARSSGGHSTSSRSSSHYKRRPRDGYIARLVHKLKHLFRELIYYARKNPAKVIFLLIPLISGGVLAGIARQFGIRLPSFLQGKAAGGGRHGARGGSGYYGSQGYEEHEGGGGMGALGALAGSAGGLMSVAKAFI